MIELNLELNEIDIHVDKIIKNSFKSPFIFYLLKLDAMYLNTFVVVDFTKEKITYLKSYSEENINKVKEVIDPKILGDVPHTAMPINEDRFLSSIMPVSSLHNNTLRMIDIKEKKMLIYTPEDFGLNHLYAVAESVIDNDDGYFYMSFLKKDESSTEFYKLSNDLTRHEFIFDDEGILQSQPHQVIKFKNFIVAFGWGIENGIILIYNLKTKKIQKIFNNENAAHGVLHNDNLYYSAVNIELNKSSVKYLGPATIGKLSIVDDKLVIENIFTYESGFRYTSHKYLNPDSIITIGFPNRIFLIDSVIMELIDYKDIDKTILPEENCVDFLNNQYKDILKYSAFELSNDEKYLVTFNQKEIKLFNIKNKEVEYNIPFDIPEKFIQVTQHCDLLK